MLHATSRLVPCDTTSNDRDGRTEIKSANLSALACRDRNGPRGDDDDGGDGDTVHSVCRSVKLTRMHFSPRYNLGENNVSPVHRATTCNSIFCDRPSCKSGVSTRFRRCCKIFNFPICICVPDTYVCICVCSKTRSWSCRLSVLRFRILQCIP